MPALNVIASFQNPNGLDYMSSRLTNVRAILNETTQGKKAAVRLIGTPGLTTIWRPSTAVVQALGKALVTTWAVYADGSVWRGVHTSTPILVGNLGPATAASIVRVVEDLTGLVIATDAAHGLLATLTGLTDF